MAIVLYYEIFEFDNNLKELFSIWQVKKRHSSPLPCGRSPSSSACPLHVRVITVSTMWFTQQVGMEDIVVIPRKNRPKYMRACYSFHSSYSEVRDVVMYLRPRRVFPNVIPLGHNMKQVECTTT